MEAKAYIKNLKISPKKLRFLLDDIKRKKPEEALVYLLYTPKKGAKLFYKAIKSAISNAKNTLKTSEDKLEFKTLLVEEGRKLKRFRAGARGIAKPYVRKSSHIRIALIASQTSKEESKKPEEPVKPVSQSPTKKTATRSKASPDKKKSKSQITVKKNKK